MSEKCQGCGAIIQFDDNLSSGFIREEVYLKRKSENKEILCERCFRLKHYNEVEKITIDEEKFLNIAKDYVTNNMLVCYIVDLFDLEGTLIKNINEVFPHNEILLIGNKYDLFMRSNRPTKLKKYLSTYLDENNIKTVGTIVTTASDVFSARKVYDSIKKIIDTNNLSREVFFFGMTNSGKTTLLKSIGEAFNNEDASHLVTSKAISTTIGISKLEFPDFAIIDSPGVVNPNQITYYLNKKTIDYIMPKSVIKPSVFQLNPLQSIYINGFAVVSLLESSNKKTSLVFYVANAIKLHRSKYQDPLSYLENHYKDLFLLPNKTERKKLGKMVKHEFLVDDDHEITLSGIGFVSVNGTCKLEVLCYEKINVELRKKMI